jgi:heavy metal sensor kinase
MKPLPFRFRLALLAAAISGGVLLAFGGVAWYLMHRERVAALDREMRALAYRHPGWMGGRGNYERLASTLEFVFGEDRREQLLLWVTDTQGQVRYRSPHWPPGLTLTPADLELTTDPTPATGSPAPRRGPPWAAGGSPGAVHADTASLWSSKIPRFRTVHTGATTWRLGVLGDGEARLVIGLDCADLHRELVRMRSAFLVALPLALLVIGGGGWWLAGRALRPLRAIARVADGMTARGLGQRIAPSTEDPEISRLIRVLNGMMDRLETSFRQATRFSADASHELKTPLTVMQGELEAALQAAPAGSREQQTFAELLEQTQRLKSITRSLLLLAQADAGPLPLTRTPLDLGATLQSLVEDLDTLASDPDLRIETHLPSSLPVVADEALLRQALSNVLHNAVRYNEPGGRVRVTLEVLDNAAVLDISNGGPGIPAPDQPRIFDRFFRGDTARSGSVEGTGLGLSLAREIVRAHGGTLALHESRPGLTCFRLILPLTPPPP